MEWTRLLFASMNLGKNCLDSKGTTCEYQDNSLITDVESAWSYLPVLRESLHKMVREQHVVSE